MGASAPPEGPGAPGAGASSALGRHNSALDGMRAVGMTAMLGYHAQLSFAKGAFFSLSQFFTLSGFLITALLLRQSERSGGIRLRDFWARRFRRLMPGAVLGLAGAVVFGATVADGAQLDRLPGQIVAAALYVANWFFIFSDQSYVEQFVSPSPVQHFWSLAVEEQFYLLLPLGLVGLFRFSRSTKVLAIVLGVLALASTALMVGFARSGVNLDRIYYGTDTRAAEILIGALLAVVLHRWPIERLPDGARRVLPVAGLIAYLASLWAMVAVPLRPGLVWEGGMFVFALGSALVIAGLLEGRGPLAAVLGWGPLAYLGRITYGIYLFNWPLFLWLTPERLGFGGVARFAVVTAITVVLAAASYHLIEQPILRGALLAPSGRRPLVVAPAALSVVVLAGVVVPTVREAEDPLETIAGPAADAPVLVGDGVLRVLVVPDERSAPVVAEMEALAAVDDGVELAVADPLACDGLDEAAGTCANWVTEWSELVTSFDPDVAVVTANAWPGPDPSGLPADDAEGRRRWTEGLLEGGVEVLAARGATVLWAPVQPADARAAIAENNQPFALAMRALTSGESSFRALGPNPPPRTTPAEVVSFDRAMAELVLDEAAVYERRGGDLPRVLVVGDSTARSLSWGLERWAAEEGLAVVWATATDGCGLAEGGVYRTLSGTTAPFPPECAEVDDRWAEQLEAFDPDVVVVLTSIWDLSERKLDDWPTFARPGDARFDDFLLAEFTDAVDELGAGGAEVRWLQAPCVGIGVGGLVGGAANTDAMQTEVIEHLNRSILPRLVEARPEVELVDLFPTLCPEGEFERSLGGVADVRPDGVHFSTEGALWLAEQRGHEILGLDERDGGAGRADG